MIAFQKWRQQAIQAGRIKHFDDADVENRTEILTRGRSCKSDDQHVIALAQVSGSRFLYSDDGDLHEDFKNNRLINRPRGVIYSTKDRGNFTPAHRRLLGRNNICRNRA